MSGAAIAQERRPETAPRALVAAALADLRADFDELAFHCRSGGATLAATEADLAAAVLEERTRDLLSGQLERARRRCRAAAERLHSLDERARSAPPTVALVDELAAEKASLADLLRVEQTLLAALAGAADWQSPSFDHSTLPAAGRQLGRIRPHWNDYKRDRHLDGDAYERAYLEAMVDQPAGLRALLTSCGMAAFTTLLLYLRMEGKLERPVLAGAGLYHETKLLLERALPGSVRYMDERDTPALLRAIDELAPSAVFLDSLSNTAWMPVPELAPLIERLRGASTYLVVDNTGLSAACQPFALAGESVRLLVFESLLKYAQLGLDRVNAGVIVARADEAALLDDYREHLGTNVADVAVYALPRPDRRVLERRLQRLQRNALLLARRLSERSKPSVTVIYPGLPSHPCARDAAGLPFRGGCFSIVFGDRDRRLRRERALVDATLAEAEKRGVPLLAGSSFGFDTTRIYLTAARAAHCEPFVRIAAGTEHRLALEPLAEALAAALAAVAR
ncbi:MAG TPA: PLP-dependent transferase [Gaiellaceae bacterium]|nr:PLP-dependent transferase [Gaiellaceae bacterium]